MHGSMLCYPGNKKNMWNIHFPVLKLAVLRIMWFQLEEHKKSTTELDQSHAQPSSCFWQQSIAEALWKTLGKKEKVHQ